MTDDLKAAIKSIETTVPNLNKAVDQAGQLVRQVEAFLERQKLGVAAEVVVESRNLAEESSDGESLDKFKEYLSLAYSRVGGKFRIAVVTEKVRDGADLNGNLAYFTEVIDETPWLNSSRDMRLRTFPKLPDLLKVLAESAEASEKSLAETNATVAELLKAFE